MSKNIVIQEGGVGRQFVADKLKTALVGGGSCNWVPEDEVQLSTLTVSENGTYSAEDEGGYGYSRVIVNVPGGAGGPPGGEGSSIVGTDPNTGNEELVSVDDGGTIGTTELPSSITIETAPTKVDYIDGDAIDYSGMVVKAYTKNGELWTDADHPNGIIPTGELNLSVTEADGGEAYDEWSDGSGVKACKISYEPQSDIDWAGRTYTLYSDIKHLIGVVKNAYGSLCDAVWGTGAFSDVTFLATRYESAYWTKKLSGQNTALNIYSYSPENPTGKFDLRVGTSDSPGDGDWVRHAYTEENSDLFKNLPESTSSPDSSGEMHPDKAQQTIPVQWARSGDAKILESSFEILVEPPININDQSFSISNPELNS